MAEPAKLRAAIYARVSTADQQYAMQLTEVCDYVRRMGWEAVEYAEQASSVKRRPELERLMNDARGKKVDVVVVWKLDRFARSLSQLIEYVQDLDRAGVRFVAITQGIDTDRRNPASRLLMQILGAIAEFERALIVERVKSGLAQARRQGRVGGRPKKVKASGKLPAYSLSRARQSTPLSSLCRASRKPFFRPHARVPI